MTSPDIELERRIASRLLDVLIRAGLILALVLLCYRIFSPFLTLMVWALILAVTLYPLHQMLAARMGGKQGWSATVLTLLGVALIVAPTAVSDELARRLGATAGHRRAEQHPGNPAAARRSRRMAAGRRQGACALVQGPCRPSCPDPEHAATDRRHRQVGARLRRRHRRRTAGVRRLLHHRRDHHGLRAGRQRCQPGDLLAHRRPGARRGVHQAVDGNHPRRRGGRPRRGPDPGHHRRSLPAARRRSLGRRPRGHRPRPRHRTGACTAGHPAGDWLHLDDR